MPQRPWYDILFDFVTGLPLSEGKTTILTVVERFSTMVHLNPLPRADSAKDTAEAMLFCAFFPFLESLLFASRASQSLLSLGITPSPKARPFWPFSVGVVDDSTWWTGRSTALRRVAHYLWFVSTVAISNVF